MQARRKKSEIASMPEEQLDNSTESKKPGKKKENTILGEFVAKAYVLLREAGGKVSRSSARQFAHGHVAGVDQVSEAMAVQLPDRQP